MAANRPLLPFCKRCAAVATWLAVPACDAGSPASPASDAGRASPDATAGGDGEPVGPFDAATDVAEEPPAPGYAVCPDAMVATFPSIVSQMLAGTSCGTDRSYDCHSSSGALPMSEGGTGSLLDFTLAAAAVYAELLGDGGGRPSVNVGGDAGGIVLRVAPGDADASLLYIKLAMPTATDPRYGKAMPPTGLVCPDALDTVRAWIDKGAPAR